LEIKRENFYGAVASSLKNAAGLDVYMEKQQVVDKVTAN